MKINFYYISMAIELGWDLVCNPFEIILTSLFSIRLLACNDTRLILNISTF